MAEPTEDFKDTMQRDLDAEINLINEFLTDVDRRRRHMCHFVSGLQVAVTSILFAARSLEERHSKESKEANQEEEVTTTQPCPKEAEESPKKAEEQLDDTLTEDEEASENNLSSELMQSLNNTLGDLEQAEKKLIEMEMDSQGHTAAAQSHSSESCYLDFAYEFLADFRLKLQKSCEEFISLESQALALLEEKKALQDLNLQISKSPRKTMKPKHNLNTAASDMEPVQKKVKSEDSGFSEIKFTLPKDMYQNSIPLDTVAARKDIDANDNASFETKTIVAQNDKDKDTAPTCTNETSKDATKANTSPIILTNIKQTNNTDVPSHKTPPKAAAASTTEGSPCDKMPKEVAPDERYDSPSPIGMRRMFGSFSAEPKIPLPHPSPIITVENSPAFSPSPTSVYIANSRAMKLNIEASPSDTVIIQRNTDVGDSSPSQIRPTIPQKEKDEVTVPTYNTTTSERDNTKRDISPSTHTNIKQTSNINAPSYKTPPKDACSPTKTEGNTCDKKEVPEQTEEVPTDEEYDSPSPLGMGRMFGSFSQEPKISFPPPSPVLSVENSPVLSISPGQKSDLEVSPSGTTDAQETCDSTSSQRKLTVPEKDEDKDTVLTHTNITQTNDKDVSDKTTLPEDTCSSTMTERSPCDKKEVPEQMEEIGTDEEYDGPSPVGMRRMFGSFSQEPKISLPPPSPVSSAQNSPVLSSSSTLKLDLEVSPSQTTDEQKAHDSTSSETRHTAPEKYEDKDTVPTCMTATSEEDNTEADIPSNAQKNTKQTKDKDASNKIPPLKDTCLFTATEGSLCGRKEHPEQIADDKCEELSPRMFDSNYQESRTSLPSTSPQRRNKNSPVRPKLKHDVSPVSIESGS